MINKKQQSWLTPVYINFWIGICIFSSFIFTGCAYFNAFYNAKAFYNKGAEKLEKAEGQNIPAEAISNFNEARVQAYKIIGDYPKSRWVDNAVLLIIKCYFYSDTYDSCLVKCEEFFNNFPKSNLTPEVKIFYAKTLINIGKEDIARIELLSLISSKTKENIIKEARITLGDLYFNIKEYSKSAEAYQAALRMKNNKLQQSEIRLKIADCYLNSESYNQAGDEFKKVLTLNPPTKYMQFLCDFGYILCSEKLGDYDKALKQFGNLLGNKDYAKYYSQIYLEIAHCWELKNNINQTLYVLNALNNFEPNKVIDVSALLREQNISLQAQPKPESSAPTRQIPSKNADALFSIGEIYLNKLGDYSTAKQYYSAASRSQPSKVLLDLINQRLNSVSEIETISKVLMLLPPTKPIFNKGDTTAVKTTVSQNAYNDSVKYENALKEYEKQLNNYKSSLSEVLYRLAEIYLIDFELPDSAISFLEKIQHDFPEMLISAKALLYEIDIYQSLNKGDMEKLKEKLLTEYKDTEYAEFLLYKTLKSDSLYTSKTVISDSAEILYTQAEEAYFKNEFDKSLSFLSTLFERFPNSPFAPKALYTIGWINENHLQNNQAAIEAYLKLTSNYLSSVYASAVKVKIDSVRKIIDREERLNVVEKAKYAAFLSKVSLDTIYMNSVIQKFSNQDSDCIISLIPDSLLSAHTKVISDKPVVIPDSLKHLDIKGYIEINLLIKETGEIEDAIFFHNSTGILDLENVIEEAALKSKYSPALNKSNKPVSEWIIRRYVFPRK